MRILVVDDHRLFCEGLRLILARAWPGSSVAIANDALQAGDFLRRGRCVDLVLLDLNLPGLAGVDALKHLLPLCGAAPVVALSGSASPETISDVLSHGATAFLPKDTDWTDLIERLQHIAAKRDKSEDEDAVPGSGELTPRERAVLSCLVDGSSNKEIARNLGVSEVTVRVHLKHAFAKLGVRNRTQAVASLIRTMG
jgi:two-component system, NarL family, nitrate/nitrite response regulator NarL